MNAPLGGLLTKRATFLIGLETTLGVNPGLSAADAIEVEAPEYTNTPTVLQRNYAANDLSPFADIIGKIISGFADGTFVTAERNEQAWNLKVGVDGEGTRAKNNNRSGKVTLTLMQSSSSNDYLSATAAADELSNAGALPLLIRDASGRTVISALTAWIQKYANGEFAKEVSQRQWVIETDELIMLVAGN